MRSDCSTCVHAVKVKVKDETLTACPFRGKGVYFAGAWNCTKYTPKPKEVKGGK